ncbi:MAG: glycosyltransferase, partial [Bacteroidetes bacterium]|nr:glycosyltransferase [Bacteroidota bacterium]
MNNNKILSIIILTWNSMILLQRCLASIKGNTNLNNYEIIIIDNNSSDGTREFLMSQENNTSYHFIFNDQNKGVGPARNQGIKIAAGEYIML